jgi:uncharacterized GH25 family protein
MHPITNTGWVGLWLTIALGIGANMASAHDFWVEPDSFWSQPQAVTPITLQVGHGPARQRSPIPLRRIERFEAFAPGGAKMDLRGDLNLGGNNADGGVQFRTPGTYVLVLQTDNRAQSHQPAARFNAYLEEEGLTPALEERRRTHRMEVEGSEIYSRVAKTIVQVGEVAAQSEVDVARPLDLPLEIVLEKNPYAEPRAPELPARVLYEGRPIAGALLKLTNLEHDAEPFETHVTDRDGRAIFGMPTRGRWLLNVIWTKSLPQSQENDFETVFSSLSFGFPW